jgi:hypothetical protein
VDVERPAGAKFLAREWRDPAFREGDGEAGRVYRCERGEEMNISWQKGT